MSWAILGVLAFALTLAVLVALQRQRDLGAMAQTVSERETVREQGGAKAELQHPVVDLSAAWAAPPASPLARRRAYWSWSTARPQWSAGPAASGAAACERECPVDAITVTIADAGKRDDIPALSPGLEAVGTPGLFLAGEVDGPRLDQDRHRPWHIRGR